MEVIGWIDYDDIECGFIDSYGGVGGWFKNGMRWSDYIEHHSKKEAEYAECLRQSIVKRGLRYTGSDHQNASEGVPVFSDGTYASFSFRAWGDLMAAVWSEQENKDYCYMDFYC